MDQRLAVSAPHLDENCALFLDIDGTLLDIAISPDAVVVPPMLPPLLARLSSWLNGALAVVSGRPLDQIDALLTPMKLTCAAEHGAVLRMPDGTIEHADVTHAIPEAWRTTLFEKTRTWTGVLVEPKSFGVAVHFRKAPDREAEVHKLVQAIVGQNNEDFEVLPASMAFEIRNRKLTKAGPVYQFMKIVPFSGRAPIFVGDDVTDHDGFRAALDLGGQALDVHRVFDGKPSEVLRWLDEAAPSGR